jgi:hypothetical protein
MLAGGGNAMSDELLLRQDGEVVWATLNRPERLNALNPALVEQLRATRSWPAPTAISARASAPSWRSAGRSTSGGRAEV